MSELLLVDLSAIFHQAWHSTGAEDNADQSSRSTVRRVRELAKQYDHVAICLDAYPNWRHALSADYKRSRKSKPPEFGAQLKRCVHDLDLDGFPLWQVENMEADDVIASACRLAWNGGHFVTIATSDKDLHALIGPNVAIHNTRDNLTVGEKECVEKFGVPPAQLGDWLALQGDKSDDVAGLDKVGDITATLLLRRHGNISRIIEAANDPAVELEDIAGKVDAKGKALKPMTPKLRQTIVDGVATLALARQLVSLRDDLKIPIEEAFAPRVEKPRTPQEDFDDMNDPEREAIQAEEQAATRQPEPASSPLATTQPPVEPIEAEAFDPSPQVAKLAPIPRPAEWRHSLEPMSLKDLRAVSQALHDSRLFSQFGSWQAIFATGLLARSHEVELVKMLLPGVIHSIKGKITMSAQLIVGLILRSGMCEYFDIVETTSEKAVYVTKRKGAKHEVRFEFTIAEAKSAGYLGKPDSSWSKTPKTMLRHRCSTELARAVYPDVVGGLYEPQEMEDA